MNELSHLKPDLLDCVRGLITTIEDDYRADDESDEPSMQVTFALHGSDFGQWTYQTGDNSYSGSAYFLPHWAVVTLYRDTDPAEIVEDVLGQWAECIDQSS